MPQFGASLADDSRVIIYDCNLFIVQATGRQSEKEEKPNCSKQIIDLDRIVQELQTR